MKVNNNPSCLKDLPGDILDALHSKGWATVYFDNNSEEDREGLYVLGLENEIFIITMTNLLETALKAKKYSFDLSDVFLTKCEKVEFVMLIFKFLVPPKVLKKPIGLEGHEN